METPQATSPPPWGSALDSACESTDSAGRHPPLRLGLTRNSGGRREKSQHKTLPGPAEPEAQQVHRTRALGPRTETKD